MKRILLLIVLAALAMWFALLPANAKSDTLYRCYERLGMEWTSVSDRAITAAENGIWEYTGSMEQNTKLRDILCPAGQDDIMGYSVVTGYQKTLRTTMNSTQTTVPVTSLELRDGTVITMDMLGDRVFVTLEPGKNKEEIVMCTGIIASPAQFTGCTRGLAFSGNTTTAVSDNQESHGAGSIVVISNVHYVYEEKLDVRGNDLIFGDGTTSTNKTIYFNDGTATSTAMRWDYATNQLLFRRSGDTVFRVMPTQLRGTYADYASLPSSGNSIGDIAITTDDSKLYTWSGTTWVLAGGSSGAGTVYKTNKLGSESDGGDLKTFSLTAGSWPSSNFLLVYKNGQSQREGASYDYTVTDSDTIEFTTTLASDDTVQMFVVSVDLYNPAWGAVNASIIPDTNNAYDIGSSTLRFKDVYTTGTLYTNSATSWNQVTSTASAYKVPMSTVSGTISYDWLALDVGKNGVATTTFTLDSTYQNVSGKSKLISVEVAVACSTSGVGGGVFFYMSSTSTPSIRVGNSSTFCSGYNITTYGTVSFIVPNNYYYRTVKSQGEKTSVGVSNFFQQDI